MSNVSTNEYNVSAVFKTQIFIVKLYQPRGDFYTADGHAVKLKLAITWLYWSTE